MDLPKKQLRNTNGIGIRCRVFSESMGLHCKEECIFFRSESDLKWPPSETTAASVPTSQTGKGQAPKLVGYIHAGQPKSKKLVGYIKEEQPKLVGYIHTPLNPAVRHNSRVGSDKRLSQAFERHRRTRVSEVSFPYILWGR